MATNTQQAAKVLSVRLLETAVIGGVVLYGVVKVLQSQNEQIIDDLEVIGEQVQEIGAEQARRTIMVQESFEHTKDRDVHK